MENGGEGCKREDGPDSGFDEESRGSWSWNSRSSFSDNSSPVRLGWLIGKPSSFSGDKNKPGSNDESVVGVDDDGDESKQVTKVPEMEMMKERFSKLLLGEDMSGSGKGVCPALTLSNAITNLYATVFGQLWRLEPLPLEKKSMWRREMEWLLCVSDYIVEMIPSWQTLPNGNLVEVMSSRPRLDLVINMPALRKLDNMLLEILDGFKDSEFWYVDQGIIAPEADKSVSFRKAIERQEEKWWLPVPRVPPGGLPEGTRKQLNQKLECATQILKAASAINAAALADMEVPESYLETLPKSGKACLGDIMYRYITSENFSSECLLDCLDLSSEHAALDMANRVEAAIYVWTRKHRSRPSSAHQNHHAAKSSWEIVRDLINDGDRRGLLVERAQNLLISLKQRFPGLTQTALDASKIHCNKDIGKSILESYSRILECLAFKVMERIEDLLYVDDMSKQTAKLSSLGLISPKKAPVPFPVPVLGRSAYGSPNLSPASLVSPPRAEKTPFLGGNSIKPASRGLGVKRVLSNYIGSDVKVNDSGLIVEGPGPVSNETNEGPTSDHPSVDTKESSTVDDESRPNRYYMYSSFR